VNTETVIYRQAYRYRDRSFEVWSYLDEPDPASSSLRFAFQAESETVEGFADRADAVRKARERIDELPAKPVEETPAIEAPKANQGQQPQPSELDQLRAEAQARPAQLTLFAKT